MATATTTDDLKSLINIHSHCINDDYKIFANMNLGEGISGKVYKCEHRQTGRKCALKVL